VKILRDSNAPLSKIMPLVRGNKILAKLLKCFGIGGKIRKWNSCFSWRSVLGNPLLSAHDYVSKSRLKIATLV